MRSVNISQFRNKLSAILAELSNYGSVQILDRDVPVAVLNPIEREQQGDQFQKLRRNGVLLAKNSPQLDLKKLLGLPVPKISGQCLSKFVTEERESGW